MEQAAADHPPVAQLQSVPAAVSGAHFALTDDLLAGRFFSIDVRGTSPAGTRAPRPPSAGRPTTLSGSSLFEKLLVDGFGLHARRPRGVLRHRHRWRRSAGARRWSTTPPATSFPVELSIVPIQLSKAYELNAFLQDISTSTASGVSSEIGRIREEHASVLQMIAASLEDQPPAPGRGGAPGRCARSSSTSTRASRRSPPTRRPAPAPSCRSRAVAEDADDARADAERVRDQIDQAQPPPTRLAPTPRPPARSATSCAPSSSRPSPAPRTPRPPRPLPRTPVVWPTRRVPRPSSSAAS